MPNSIPTVAIAVFVKTPGYSPLKTRLAATIGHAAAQSVFVASVTALEAFLHEAVREAEREQPRLRLKPHWAVAETAALDHALWTRFPRVHQGEGGLGARLHHVYSELLHSHDAVMLIGGDLPHFRPEDLDAALASMCTPGTFVVGPADDGGFYLCGGNTPVPRTLWDAIPYSVQDTGAELTARLATLGPVVTLAPNFDIDTAADLALLRAHLAAQPAPATDFRLPYSRAPGRHLTLLKDHLDRIGGLP